MFAEGRCWGLYFIGRHSRACQPVKIRQTWLFIRLTAIITTQCSAGPGRCTDIICWAAGEVGGLF